MKNGKIPLNGLKLAFDRMEDGDGKIGRAGNWKIALGGYDHGYEIYYKNEAVMRVNYELKEYEFYPCEVDNLFNPSTISMIKRILEISPRFENIGEIDDNGEERQDDFDEYDDEVDESKASVKRLNMTQETFEKSKYFKRKYGTLEYVSESGRIFKTSKGKLLKFVK